MERHHSEDLGIDGRLILKGILNNRMEGRRLDWSGLGQGQAAGCCEDGDEQLVFKNDGYYLTSWKTVSFSRKTLLRGVSALD